MKFRTRPRSSTRPTLTAIPRARAKARGRLTATFRSPHKNLEHAGIEQGSCFAPLSKVVLVDQLSGARPDREPMRRQPKVFHRPDLAANPGKAWLRVPVEQVSYRCEMLSIQTFYLDQVLVRDFNLGSRAVRRAS